MTAPGFEYSTPRCRCAAASRNNATACALGSEPFQNRGREPRFADAGLARDQHHLPFAGLCLDQSTFAAVHESAYGTKRTSQ
jgi:hypothetical protein